MAKYKEKLETKTLEYDEEGINIQDGKDATELVTYSTGSLGLDIMTNGLTPGVAQMWGPDGIGKTTLLLIMAGEFQKALGYKKCRVYYHATEGRWNPRLMKMAPLLKTESVGEEDVTPDGKPCPIFRITRPKSGEKMFSWIEKTLKQDGIKFFHIIDSVDGINSEANEGKTLSESEKTAATASLMTRFLKQSSSYSNHYGHIIAFTNQVRDKISAGMSHVSGIGKQKSGGHAADHYSNLRLNFEKLWTDLYIFENPNDTKSRIIGHQMSIKIEKLSNSGNVHSKVAIPFIYNHGIDRNREIATLGEAFGLITKKGAFYAIDEKNVAQGQIKFLEYLKAEKKVAERLEKDIKNMAGVL